MDRNPDRLIELIERRMAGSTYNKTEEEKANQLFDYQPRADFDAKKPAEVPMTVSFVSHVQAEQALREIFTFYVSAYAQLKVNNKTTFEQITHRHNIMDFQAFVLFCRQFRLVSQMFPLNSIRVIFKKHSNYGKTLTYDDFVNLLASMAHEKEAVAFFGVTVVEAANRQAADETELQHLYNYLGLANSEAYRCRFQPIVQAFDSSSKVELAKIPYKYKKLSQPQLLSKAMHRPRPSLQLPMTDRRHSLSEKHLPAADQNIVSWDMLQKRIPQYEKLSKVRAMIRDEEEDNIYLREYADRKKQRTDNLKEQIRKRIESLTKNDQQRQKKILDKLNHRTFANEIL